MLLNCQFRKECQKNHIWAVFGSCFFVKEGVKMDKIFRTNVHYRIGKDADDLVFSTARQQQIGKARRHPIRFKALMMCL